MWNIKIYTRKKSWIRVIYAARLRVVDSFDEKRCNRHALTHTHTYASTFYTVVFGCSSSPRKFNWLSQVHRGCSLQFAPLSTSLRTTVFTSCMLLCIRWGKAFMDDEEPLGSFITHEVCESSVFSVDINILERIKADWVFTPWAHGWSKFGVLDE